MEEVAKRNKIPLTKAGKIDRRFKIGRVLAPLLDKLQNDEIKVLTEIQKKVDSNKHLLKQMIKRQDLLMKK